VIDAAPIATTRGVSLVGPHRPASGAGLQSRNARQGPLIAEIRVGAHSYRSGYHGRSEVLGATHLDCTPCVTHDRQIGELLGKVMSATQSWSMSVGWRPRVRLGTIRQPCLESVVIGTKPALRRHNRLSSPISRSARLWSPANSRGRALRQSGDSRNGDWTAPGAGSHRADPPPHGVEMMLASAGSNPRGSRPRAGTFARSRSLCSPDAIIAWMTV
jgi:hypothetical protein